MQSILIASFRWHENKRCYNSVVNEISDERQLCADEKKPTKNIIIERIYLLSVEYTGGKQ